MLAAHSHSLPLKSLTLEIDRRCMMIRLSRWRHWRAAESRHELRQEAATVEVGALATAAALRTPERKKEIRGKAKREAEKAREGSEQESGGSGELL